MKRPYNQSSRKLLVCAETIHLSLTLRVWQAPSIDKCLRKWFVTIIPKKLLHRCRISHSITPLSLSGCSMKTRNHSKTKIRLRNNPSQSLRRKSSTSNIFKWLKIGYARNSRKRSQLARERAKSDPNYYVSKNNENFIINIIIINQNLSK